MLTASQTQRYKRWCSACCLALFIPLLVLFVEAVARGSLLRAWDWMVQAPAAAGWTLLLVTALFLLLTAGTGLRLAGGLLVVLLGLLAAAHATKWLLVGQPLFPWDFVLSRQGADIFSGSFFPHRWAAVAAFVAAAAGLGAIARQLPRVKLRLWQRSALALLAGTFLYGTAFYRHTFFGRFINHQETALVRDFSWDQRQNYQANGFALSFVMNVQLSVITEPSDYSHGRVHALLQRIETQPEALQPLTAASHPAPIDLLVVINEAFWDPTLLPGVTFSRDPLAFLHSLPAGDRGWLFAPVFGGWTCNSEFELLTSCTMAFLPRGSAAYQQYVRQPLPALPQLLSDAGYRTLAIHPYYRWYWQRDTVYPLLGFQEFRSLETYATTRIAGLYTADDWVAEQVIAACQAAADQPLFVFALTMQNHAPYDGVRSSEASADITVQADLPADSIRLLENYTRGAADADRMLRTLAEYVQSRARPTLLVFLGDHLPYLGPDYQLYRQTGFVRSDGEPSAAEHYRLHRVPAIYLANFPCDIQPRDVSMCFLAPQILRRMGISPAVQMSLAERVSHRYPVLAETWLLNAAGMLCGYDTESDEMLMDYQLLQYDLLFGRQYSLEENNLYTSHAETEGSAG